METTFDSRRKLYFIKLIWVAKSTALYFVYTLWRDLSRSPLTSNKDKIGSIRSWTILTVNEGCRTDLSAPSFWDNLKIWQVRTYHKQIRGSNWSRLDMISKVCRRRLAQNAVQSSLQWSRSAPVKGLGHCMFYLFPPTFLHNLLLIFQLHAVLSSWRWDAKNRTDSGNKESPLSDILLESSPLLSHPETRVFSSVVQRRLALAHQSLLECCSPWRSHFRTRGILNSRPTMNEFLRILIPLKSLKRIGGSFLCGRSLPPLVSASLL